VKKLLLIGSTLLYSGTAFAAPVVNVPPLKICYANSGIITVRKKCSTNETILSGENLGAFGLQGPAGPAVQQVRLGLAAHSTLPSALREREFPLEAGGYGPNGLFSR